MNVMREINKWMCKNGKTHLLLDGGTLTAKEGFYEAYVRDVLNREKLCVVEKKTHPHFRFFIDIDYVDQEYGVPDFEKIALEIYGCIDAAGPCVLAAAQPRPTPKGTKYGLHMIWPESIVTKQSANSLRMKILNHLGHEDWEKIIDSSVYAGSGLRMLWSLKNEDGSTPYVPWGRIDTPGGEFKKFHDTRPSVEYLKMFSIRVHHHHQNVEVPSSSTSSSSFSEIETFIQTYLPGQSKARVLKISPCKKIRGLWVSTSSKYCENIKREHKSNHVWFNIRPSSGSWSEISQRCQDEECKGYVGRSYRIPSRLIPDTNERVLDCSPRRTIYDYLPDGWKGC